MSARIPPAPTEHPVCYWTNYSHAAREGLLPHCCYDMGSAPCGATPLVAWRWDARPEGRAWYSVCRKHAKGRVAWPTPAQCKAAGQPYRRPTPKPKAPSRTQLRAKCDRAFMAHIRSLGTCEIGDGTDGVRCGGPLQCMHIIDRDQDGWGVRWNPENAVCGCSAHHAYYTHHRLKWNRWVQTELGFIYEHLVGLALAFEGGPGQIDYAAELAGIRAFSPRVPA